MQKRCLVEVISIDKEIRFIDLFGGIGGFRLGLERANSSKFKCVWYCDIDKYAVQTYNKNFNENYKPTDITKVEPRDIPDFDLLCAGFPCQSFSIAGKRRGFKDTRGTMFFEIVRIVKAKRPSYLLLENVKGLLNHGKGETFRVIVQTLSELGYDVQWMVLNSKFFGVPQNRERVFIIGSLRGLPRPEILPVRKCYERNDGTNEETSQTQISSTIDRRTGGYPKWGQYVEILSSKTRSDGFYVTEDSRPEIGQAVRRYGTEGVGPPSFTLTGQDIHGVMITSHSPRTNDPSLGGSGPLESDEHCFTLDSTPHLVNRIRRLTPVECERLQGFPDNWTEFGIDENGKKIAISDTQRYKMMGNAVTTNVIEAVVRQLLKVL